MNQPQLGDLKVWWIPQIPGKRFEYEIKTIEEGELLLDALAEYDQFLYDNNHRTDYSNAGGIVVLEDNGNPEDPSWYDYEEEYSE